jgi:protein FrlC
LNLEATARADFVPDLSAMTSVFAKFSLSYALRNISESGLSCVELWGGYPHGAVEHLDRTRILKIKHLLNRYNLRLSMFTPQQLNYPVAISSSDPTVRRYSINYFKRAIDAAALLETPRLLMNSGTSLLDDDHSRAFSQFLENAKEVCDYALNRGIRVVLEPLTKLESQLVCSLDTLKVAFNYLSNGALEVMADLVPMYLNGETLESYFNVFGPHLTVLHFVDSDGVGISHLVPGEGKIDFLSISKAIKDNEYRGTLSFELGSAYRENPVQALNKAIHNTKKLFVNF